MRMNHAMARSMLSPVLLASFNTLVVSWNDAAGSMELRGANRYLTNFFDMASS